LLLPAAALAGLLSLALPVGIAQKSGTPDPGSFETFLARRLPRLSPPDGKRADAIHWLASGKTRDASVHVDRITGLLPPKYPFPQYMEKLPEKDPRTMEYQRKLAEFLENRDKVLQIRNEYRNAVGDHKRSLQFDATTHAAADYFASKIAKWNGDICWAPASQSTDTIIRFGDEVRAVFGPIPPFDVTTLGQLTRPDGSTRETGLLSVEVEGNVVELKPNSSEPGSPLQFEHRDAAGRRVKWTTTIDKCDKPAMALGVDPCGTSSRISRVVQGNVEWVGLARKTKGGAILDADPYWLPGNPTYALLGYIGFNRVSGEVAFFDGSYVGASATRFNWKAPIGPPAGAGYKDEEGRAVSATTYDATFSVPCVYCHDNRKPTIITPYIKQQRVGYRSEELAKAFSLKALLPHLPRGMRAPYRVVGSGYTAAHGHFMQDARTIVDPTGNCTTCHGLTNQGTSRIASDAVGKLGSLPGDTAVENSYRTAWALRGGAGKSHPWMLPGDGNNLSADPPAPVLSDDDWNRLRAVLTNPDSDPQSLKVYTEAPAPEDILSDVARIADPYAPANFLASVVDNRDGPTEPLPKEIHLSWKYLNGFGGVPERDDVRFHVAITEAAIPPDGKEPAPGDYPTIDQAKGVSAIPVSGEVSRDGQITIIKDISFLGHVRFTDPVATTTPRQYRLDFPVATAKRYLIRVVAKRFCFDQSETKYSSADHVLWIDVR
jgi:hypothetical protein